MGKERKKKAKKKTTTSNKKATGSTPDINGEIVTVPPLEMDDGNGSNREHKSQEKNKYNVSDLLKKVEDCMNSFNFDLAVKFCDRALEIQPENVEVLETAGAVFVETGETDKAKTCFQSAVQMSPHSGYSKYMTLGQLLHGQEAMAAYRKGIQLMIASKTDTLQADAGSHLPASNTDISTAYCSLAEIYLTDECFGDDAEIKCCECCNKAIEYDATNPEAFQLMASYLLSQQNMDEARKMLEKSLELWQGKHEELPLAAVPSYEFRIATSKLLIEVEKYESASGVLEDLIEESDEVPQVWYLLGWMYHITNQDSSCIKACLEKAQKLFSNFAGCQDQPMMDHITEILESLPGDTEGSQEEKNGGVEDISSDEEEMDVQ